MDLCSSAALWELLVESLPSPHRDCSHCGDPPAHRGDLLWAREALHPHQAPAGGVRPAGGEGGGQVHQGEGLSQAGKSSVRLPGAASCALHPVL